MSGVTTCGWRRAWQGAVVLLFIIGSTTAASLSTQGGSPTLVVLVRHAERANMPGDDPPISEAGQLRARALAAALADANVTAVITSSRRRTSETAQPLLDARRLTPEVISVAPGLEAQVANVAAAVRRHKGGLVLVVGHSNTVPAIVHALGGPKYPDLCEPAFSTMFVMELPASGAPRVIRTHYGAPDPAGADTCAPAGAVPKMGNP